MLHDVRTCSVEFDSVKCACAAVTPLIIIDNDAKNLNTQGVEKNEPLNFLTCLRTKIGLLVCFQSVNCEARIIMS